MTDEDQAPDSAPDPLEEIAGLKAKLKFNKIITLVVLFISLITFSILLTSTAHFSNQLKKLEAATPTYMQKKLKQVAKEMKSLSKYLDSESHSIEAYHLRINLLQEECSAANAPILTKLYRNREADYQRLLDEMLIGSQELAAMTTGSRIWLTPYQLRLDGLKNSSIKRADQWAKQP
jgi:hypothetical protein